VPHHVSTLRKTILVCIAVWAAAACPLFADEPRYDGKTLSEWLETKTYLPGTKEVDPAREAQVKVAVRAIGTNALPYLLDWLAADETRFRGSLGFSILGKAAAPAIPALSSMLTGTNDDTAPRAAMALESMGAPGRAVLRDAFTSRYLVVPNAAVIAMVDDLRAIVQPALPLLTRDLDSKNAYFRWRAAVIFSEIRGQSTLVPKFVNLLNDPEPGIRCAALQVLEYAESLRLSAVQTISALLPDSDPQVRHQALLALRRFKALPPQSSLAVSNLLSDPDIYVRRVATNVIQRFSPASVAPKPTQ
jgi:HEAT repeat protein